MNRILMTILTGGLAAGATLAPATAHAQTVGAPASATPARPFTVARTGAVPSGRSMILIPGFLSSGEVWDGTVARFRAEYDMHVLTLAGFAGSPTTTADPYLPTVRDAIIQYIRENRLEHPVIVGHSLGGFMSLWIAATAPDLVGPIVAVDGVPFLSALGDTTMTAARAAAQAEMMRTALSGMTSDGLAAQTRMAMMQQVKDTAWHAKGARWGAQSDPTVAGRAIAEMLTTDIRPDVSRIHTPVLMFMAGNGMSPEQQATTLALYEGQLRTVRGARVVAAPKALHFIMIDEPTFFQETVAAFLERAASPR